MIKKIIVVFLFLINSLAHPISYQLSQADHHRGLLSVFFSVLGALDLFEKKQRNCTGMLIDFETVGLYYDPNYGPNWWNYYFEPIDLGERNPNKALFTSTEQANLFIAATYRTSYKRGHELIQRYIKLRPHMEKRIDDFVAHNFIGHTVIGVHYRGTDKISEAPRVPYEVVINHIRAEVNRNNTIKIFVATDEGKFLEEMHKNFPGKILAIDTYRSFDGKPVHYTFAITPYQKGEDAIIDCILLSKCSKLYRTSSNLSAASMRFNPTMQEILLN